MIQFFRQNNFLTAFMLIPYTFILRLGAFFISSGPSEMESTGILYKVFSSSFENQTILSIITINIVIAFTAILVNRVVIVHRLSKAQSLIPGLIYIVLVSWMEVFLDFTGIHIANFFMMIGVLSLFKFSKKTTTGIVVFDSFFYFGVASLFYMPYLVYLPVCLLGFVYLNRFRFRDLVHAIVGLIVPFFIVGGFLYYSNGDLNLFEGLTFNTQLFSWVQNVKLLNLIPVAFYAGLILLCIINVSKLTRKNSLVVQKKINILYYFLAFSALTMFLIGDQNGGHLLILALPSSILLGMIAERIKAPAIEEFVHLVIVIMVFLIHFSQSVNILI